MKSPPFQYMQNALEIALKSPHPTNKIAAVIFGKTMEGDDFAVYRTNHWPDIIYEKLGTSVKIGNSSGTVHAETAAILASKEATEHSSLCITDPFCPNCAKNIAEAGIKTIYIDEEGFDKDFFKRRSGHFQTMSMQICERAGIDVYALNMRDKSVRTVLEIDEGYVPVVDSPIEREPIENASDAVLHDIVEKATYHNKRRKFAIALVENKKGEKFALVARAHVVIGYSLEQREEVLDLLTPQGKYSFIQEPVNRLMMHIARRGYKLIEDYLYCSQVPTSREQVNLVGAGIKRITIGDIQKCRDPQGIEAMILLKDHKIMSYT